MNKKRKTVSVDPEVKAYLDSDGRNASETVNKLVKMEMGEGVANKQLIQMRMEMEKDRYESAAQKARGHLERYNQLKERLEECEQDHRQEREEVISIAANRITPKSWLNAVPKESQISNRDEVSLSGLAEGIGMDTDELYDAAYDHVLTQLDDD